MKIDWKTWLPSFFLFCILFALPFEHKYDKLFRYYSLTLIPQGISTEYYEPKIYFYPSDLLSIALFLIGCKEMGKKFFKRGAVFLAIVFFAAVASIVASPYFNYPVAYIRLWQLFTPMAFFLFLANGPLDKKSQAQIAVWALFSSAMMQASIAIPQYLTQHDLGLRILSETPLFATIPTIPSGRLCLLDFLQSASPKLIVFRAMGTMSHPNVLGGFCVLTLFATAYLFLKQARFRTGIGIAYIIQLLALATTFSRAAIYAWALGTLFFLCYVRFRQKKEIRALALWIGCATVFVGAVFHEPYLYRGGIVNYNICTKNSDTLRMRYQKVALRMTEKHPWLGVGYGQFSCRSIPFFDETMDPKLASSGVHNIYLRLGAETGLLSLCAFLCWAGSVLLLGWRSPLSLESGFLIASFLAILFIGCCDQYPIVFQQGMLMLFGVAGLLARQSEPA